MQINDLKRDNALKSSKRVGRGRQRGKTSGKGMKGQNSRTGNSNRPALRDIVKKIPKLRGQGVNGNKNKVIINKHFAVNLNILEESFSDGEKVNQFSLLEKGLVSKKNGKIPKIKILGGGNITKKIEIEGLSLSNTAVEKIEKAGGKIIK